MIEGTFLQAYWMMKEKIHIVHRVLPPTYHSTILDNNNK